MRKISTFISCTHFYHERKYNVVESLYYNLFIYLIIIIYIEYIESIVSCYNAQTI